MHSCGSLFSAILRDILPLPLSDLIRLSGREDARAAKEKQGDLPHG